MLNQTRTVKLYGELGAKFGRVHNLAVSNVGEAVRALGVLYPEFDAHLTGSQDRGVAYAVFYGKRNLNNKDECLLPANDDEEIRIAPIIMGSKSGGVFGIILGAVLVVVGTLITPYTGAFGVAVAQLGWGMIVGGVAQLLTPTPKGSSAADKPDNQPSYTFNGAVNTQAQGNPVPVLYGELIVGSAVISAGISAEDQAYIPSGYNGAGSGGGGGGGAPVWYQEF